MVHRKFWPPLVLALALALGAACTKKDSAKPNEEPLAEKGKRVYLSHCTACHATDPKKDGSLGPAVFGSSKELVSARVLKAEYPSGYTPKRNTHLMTPLPHLEGDIDSLYAYLNDK